MIKLASHSERNTGDMLNVKQVIHWIVWLLQRYRFISCWVISISVINILLTELARSVWANLDLDLGTDPPSVGLYWRPRSNFPHTDLEKFFNLQDKNNCRFWNNLLYNKLNIHQYMYWTIHKKRIFSETVCIKYGWVFWRVIFYGKKKLKIKTDKSPAVFHIQVSTE